MAAFTVELANARTEVVAADAYQQEGPLTTFFLIDSSRAVIDSWSRRIASFRTADVVMVLQTNVGSRTDTVLQTETSIIAA